MSSQRRTAFTAFLSIILSASLCLNAPCHSCESRNLELNQNTVIASEAKQSHYLAPKSDLDEDLGIIGWGVSVTKDIEKQTGKPADAILIEDLFKARSSAAGRKTLDEAYRAQGYTVDAIADQETVLISGKGHGIIFYNSLYEPSADILSAKRVVKKGSLSKNVSFIIYNDLYSGILDELRGIEFDNKNLAAYVPIEVVQKLVDAEAAGERSRDESLRDLFKEPLAFDKSSVVSIDLSGFTAMTDKLTEILAKEKDPVRQAEAKKFVIEITNELFADIANVIDKFDASIIKFGGDARLVLVTRGTSATRALEMAQEVQLILRYFGGILSEYFKNVEAVDINKIGNIRASIGISSGTAYLVVPTDNYGLKDVVPLGDVFYRAIQAQDEAKKGITITEETRQQLIEEGRDGLFSVHPPDKLPPDRYAPEDRKVLEEKKVHVVDQGKMSFLDYEVRDRINFTFEYMTAVFNYLRKEKFETAGFKKIRQVTEDFDRWKDELAAMKSQVVIGDLSTLDRLRDMRKRIMEIRVAVDQHLLSFFPDKDPHAAGETQENLAKMSVKKDYGRYVADRVGELFYRFRTEANRRAFYSKETLEKVKMDLASFLPRGFEEYILKEEKKDFSVDRMNFQNARIMFVQVYGLKELYEKTLAGKGPAEAARIINEFYRKANSYATPENGIIYLKSDPGAQYLKMIYLGGLKYLSGVNPDTEMIKLAENLHKTAQEFGLEMKIGINSGPIILGLTGTNRRELTTISPEINLAARLGAYGRKGETIVSSRVYYASKDEVEYKERTDFYKDGARGIKVKGVSAEIPVFEPVKLLPVQKRGKFLRLKELAVAKEWIDNYLETLPSPLTGEGQGGGGKLDALLIQTKELGLGSETLAYEVERYAESAGFKSFGGKGKDEYEIMKTLLEEFCKITANDTPGERLAKIQFTVSKYAPDMTEYYPVLKILFPFIEFPESEIVNNLGDDEKIIILNKLIEKFFTNKLDEVEDGKRSPIFLRIFDTHHIKGASVFLAPLLTALKDRNILIELVSNGPLPESLGSVEVLLPLKKAGEGVLPSPLTGEGEGGGETITLSNLFNEPNRTILVDRMDKGQILEVFHATCEFANKTALLREIDKLALDETRKIIDTDKMIKDLGLPPETVVGTIPMKDILTYVKKLLSDKIYLLSGQGNPLIARHQAKRFIDLFYQKNIPEDQKGTFLLKEVLSQNISGDNIAAFFRTQYNNSHFNNPRYRHILFDALCLGTEFDQEVLVADSMTNKTETQKRINELIDAGILRRGERGRLIFDHYIYDVFIKHADIDNIRRGRLKLARLMEQLYEREDGSINPEHINELAELYYNALNLNVTWDKQSKLLGINKTDISKAITFLEQSAKQYEEMTRLNESVDLLKRTITILEYEKTQNISTQDNNVRIAQLFTNQGDIHRTLGNVKESQEAYKNAFTLSMNNAEKVRILSDGIFNLYLWTGDITNAEKTLHEVEAIIHTVEPDEERNHALANFLNRKGIIYGETGNQTLEKEYYKKGIELTKKTNNKAVMAKIYVNFGNLYRNEGKLIASTRNLMKALTISKEIDAGYQAVYALQNLATNYSLSGKPANTIAVATEAIRIAKNMKNIPLQISPLIFCGEGYRLLGKYDKALGYYAEAKAIIELFGARYDEKVDLLKGIGVCLKKNHTQSIASLREAAIQASFIKENQLRLTLLLDCWGYLLEEHIRYGELKEALKLISEIETHKKEIPPELIDNRDIKIRIGVIERLICEIDYKLYQNKPGSLINVAQHALSCLNNAQSLNHRLGIARGFVLLLKIYNQIPSNTPHLNSHSISITNAFSIFFEAEQFFTKSKIPSDKILLAEIYYEMSKIATLPPHLNPISQARTIDSKDYIKKSQSILKRLIKEKVEDGRIAILQDKLLEKPTAMPISTKDTEEAA